MIELSTSFELECEIIDKEHRKLIDMVNSMVDAMAGGRAAECAELAPGFVTFAKQHFAQLVRRKANSQQQPHLARPTVDTQSKQ